MSFKYNYSFLAIFIFMACPGLGPHAMPFEYIEKSAPLEHLCALLKLDMPRSIPEMETILSHSKIRLALTDSELDDFKKEKGLLQNRSEITWYRAMCYFAGQYEAVVRAMRWCRLVKVPRDKSSYNAAIYKFKNNKGQPMTYREVIGCIDEQNSSLTDAATAEEYSKAFYAICERWFACYLQNHEIYSPLLAKQQPIPVMRLELEKLIDDAAEELRKERRNRVKIVIMQYMRCEIEGYEIKYFPFIDMSKKEILKFIKRKLPKFGLPLSISKNKDLSIHLLKWMYILLYSQHPDIIALRKLLSRYGIRYYQVALCLARFYDFSSVKIHNMLEDLTLSEIETALEENGWKDKDDIFIIKAIYGIPKGLPVRKMSTSSY